MPDSIITNPQLLGSAGHYENFPVASVLVPARLRPAIAAIYRFARYADDVADEGDSLPADRLLELARLQDGLSGLARHPITEPLHPVITRHKIPVSLLSDLLSAFTQDVHGAQFVSRTELMDYCSRSANPVGRIILRLFECDTATALPASDAICSALQLINFAQDIGQDFNRGRNYIPADEMGIAGVTVADLQQCSVQQSISAPVRSMLSRQCETAMALLRQGPPLLSHVPLRLKLELATIIASGYATLYRVQTDDPFANRIKLGRRDAARIALTALRILTTRTLP
ncbi:MAG: squalene synthase HpnC [Burkholderiaceae bacterium]